MSFKFSCYASYHLKWYSPNWISFLYKAVMTIGIGLACVKPLGKNRQVFKSFQFILSKDKDKGQF